MRNRLRIISVERHDFETARHSQNVHRHVELSLACQSRSACHGRVVAANAICARNARSLGVTLRSQGAHGSITAADVVRGVFTGPEQETSDESATDFDARPQSRPPVSYSIAVRTRLALIHGDLVAGCGD
jgi:hypothetical protein